jgi:hypothetical protein
MYDCNLNRYPRLDPHSCSATFRLLITHESLARYVRELTLPGFSNLTLSECQLLRTQLTAALRKMKSLQKLVFCHIPPFCHAQDSHKHAKANLEFIHILSLVRSSLKELWIHYWRGSSRGLHHFQTNAQSLHLGLTRIFCGEDLFFNYDRRDGSEFPKLSWKNATMMDFRNQLQKRCPH